MTAGRRSVVSELRQRWIQEQPRKVISHPVVVIGLQCSGVVHGAERDLHQIGQGLIGEGDGRSALGAEGSLATFIRMHTQLAADDVKLRPREEDPALKRRTAGAAAVLAVTQGYVQWVAGSLVFHGSTETVAGLMWGHWSVVIGHWLEGRSDG